MAGASRAPKMGKRELESGWDGNLRRLHTHQGDKRTITGLFPMRIKRSTDRGSLRLFPCFGSVAVGACNDQVH